MPAEKAFGIERRTVNTEEEEQIFEKKAENFKKEILESAIEYVGIDSADDMTLIGGVPFKDMLQDRVLKKLNLSSYNFPEKILLDA
jgi:hypothetical protein